MQGGYRSPLGYWVGGAGAPPARGSVRSLLAFWMGGAYGYGFVPAPLPVPVPGPVEGVAFGKRPFIDDDEVMEFLQWWTLWNSIE